MGVIKVWCTYFSVLSCVTALDHKKQTQPMAVTDQINIQDITSDNIVEAIHAKVQQYKEEPMYYLRIGKANCLIEVLVNDFPVYKSYELSNLASPLRINSKILKSGTQTVTVRMYPVGDLIKEEYEHGETITQLGDASAVSITVTQIDKQSEMDFDDEHEVMKHRSPTTDAEGEVFTGSGLPFYEYSFEFTAKVPYDLSENSWGNAADLRKVKPAYLEEEALKYYQTFLNEFQKGNKDYIAQKLFHSYLIRSQTYYRSKTEIQELWNEDLNLLDNPSIETQPITNYELIFYSRGGVVNYVIRILLIQGYEIKVRHGSYIKKIIEKKQCFMVSTCIALNKNLANET
ncbi:hypothetical protein ATE84_1440 [Aquimarina sp. MAR_2010_214]|uniref:hypothetical protein n=1 Tax=Aquimarina sp. MAR_2010_214 TaxID=1250026 RepID=UPI000C70EA42|nr:hypothetical protein [Aquimarina sp. MAR_2010_214]PKV49417.1 hypothetical protein ATE84_1440 [Aquimarina sp. MAR_2010_214]